MGNPHALIEAIDTARATAYPGVQLVLTGRDTQAIDAVAAKTRAMGVATEVLRCDLTDPNQTEAMAHAAQAAYGRIDILVNVAGGSGPIGKTGWETSHAEFQEIVELNNRLKLAEADVADEERRILTQFSGWVAEEAEAFTQSLAIAEVTAASAPGTSRISTTTRASRPLRTRPRSISICASSTGTSRGWRAGVTPPPPSMP